MTAALRVDLRQVSTAGKKEPVQGSGKANVVCLLLCCRVEVGSRLSGGRCKLSPSWETELARRAGPEASRVYKEEGRRVGGGEGGMAVFAEEGSRLFNLARRGLR